MAPQSKLLVLLFAAVNIFLCIYTGVFTFNFRSYFDSYEPNSVHNLTNNLVNNLTTNIPTTPTNLPNKIETRPPTLVLYVFSDAPGSSSSAELKKKNLDFFIKNGLCENCNVDYVFIINGDTNYVFPNFTKNVEIFKRKPLNCGAGDFEAWDEYLTKLEKGDSNHTIRNEKKYKRIMFLNDTVRGPYIDPLYVYGQDFHFTDIYARLLTNETKMVGSYINCGSFGSEFPNHAHIQSMVWMTDDVGLRVLRSNIKCYTTRYDAINHGEIGLSRKMIQSGYNIASLLAAYRGVDFRTNAALRENCNNKRDPTYDGSFYGHTIQPMEVVFFKDTRDAKTLSLADTYARFIDDMKDRHTL